MQLKSQNLIGDKSYSKRNTSQVSVITIFPNPMTDKGGQITINGLEHATFKFTDIYGHDVTGNVTLQKLDENQYLLIPNGIGSGLYLLTIIDANQKKYIQSFSVVK